MLRVHLFGRLEIWGADGNSVQLSTRKVEQLLAYLWLHRDRPQPRERLAGLFWPESSERRARLSLRQALHDLRKSLEPGAEQSETYLLLTRASVQFNPEAPCRVDVEEFESRIQEAADREDEDRARLLREAVSLYRGEFLEGCYDDWCLEEREHFSDLCLKALQELVAHHAERKEYEQAITYAKQILAKNPLLEEVHRQLMYLYYALGDRNAALQQYRECERTLREELAVEPLPETKALFKEIEERVRSTKFHEKAIQARRLIQRYPELGATFVGRDRECESLIGIWEEVAQGRGQAIFVGGEAGVGKTRISQELAGYVSDQGGLALRGRCYESEAKIPYQPWIEILRQAIERAPDQVLGAVSPLWLSEVVKLVPELTERLPALSPSSPLLSPRHEQSRLFEGLSRFLAHLSREAPLMIALDDLHWADEPTLQFTQYLIRNIAEEPVLVLMTHRPEEATEAHPLQEFMQPLLKEPRVGMLDLPPLTEHEVDELLREMLKLEGEARELTRQVFQDSNGNAFFAIEIVKSLIEAGILRLDERGQWQLTEEGLSPDYIPPTIKALIESRLRRLSLEGRRVLSIASVVGPVSDLPLLARALNRREEELIKPLEELLQARILDQEGGRYEFHHDLIREVVYGALGEDRARFYHLRVGEALEEIHGRGAEVEDVVGALAEHFYRAGEVRKALEYTIRAAALAKAAYAAQTALERFRRALDLIASLDSSAQDRELLEKRFEILRQRVEIYRLLGERDRQSKDIDELFRLAERLQDERRVSECHSEKALLHAALGDDAAAKECAARGLELKRCLRDRSGEMQLLMQLAESHRQLGEYQDAVEAYERAERLSRELGDESARGDVLQQRGGLYLYLGGLDKALVNFWEAIPLLESDKYKSATARLNLGALYAALGEREQALVHLESALKLQREIRNTRGQAFSLLNMASIHKQHDPEKALDSLRQAVALGRSVQDRYLEAFALCELGTVQFQQRNVTDAVRTLDEALALTQELDTREIEALCLSRRALILSELDQQEDAVRDSTQAVEILARGQQLEFPQEIYLNHYRVLLSVDGAKAREALQRAHDLVTERAEQIEDQHLRKSFLENIPINREILAAWQRESSS
jgi:predicted ATPase